MRCSTCFLIMIIYLCLSMSCENRIRKKQDVADTLNIETPIDSPIIDSVYPVFQFLGESIYRKENFDDTTYSVTSKNINLLYRSYNVNMLDEDIYVIESKKIYSDARYLFRLIKFRNGRQVAARTFYDYSLKKFYKSGNQIVVSMNSLYWSGDNYPSSFNSKIVILKDDLTLLRERVLAYKDGEYTYIDTMLITSDKKIYVEAIDIGFDADFKFRHILTFDSNLNKLSETIKQEMNDNQRSNRPDI